MILLRTLCLTLLLTTAAVHVPAPVCGQGADLLPCPTAPASPSAT